MRQTRYRIATPLLAGALVCGCQWGGLRNPFRDNEVTSVTTPAQRIAELESLAAQAGSLSTQDQSKWIEHIAVGLQREADPLIRERMVRTVARLGDPRSGQLLRAALTDPDTDVRVTACRLLGQRQEPETIAALAETAQRDADLDVRMAAVRELGRFQDPRATQALAAALNDADTALQRRALTAFEASAGRKFNGDLAAARAVAQQMAPPPSAVPPFQPSAGQVQLVEGRDGSTAY